jgi:hypothetical protein
MPYYMPKLAIPAPQSPDFTDNSIDFSSPLQNTLYPLRRTWILLAQVLPETSQLLVGLKGCKLHCRSEAKFCQSWVGGGGKSSSTRAERVVVGSAYSCLLQQIIRFPPFPPNILGYLFFTYIN